MINLYDYEHPRGARFTLDGSTYHINGKDRLLMEKKGSIWYLYHTGKNIALPIKVAKELIARSSKANIHKEIKAEYAIYTELVASNFIDTAYRKFQQMAKEIHCDSCHVMHQGMRTIFRASYDIYFIDVQFDSSGVSMRIYGETKQKQTLFTILPDHVLMYFKQLVRNLKKKGFNCTVGKPSKAYMYTAISPAKEMVYTDTIRAKFDLER